MAYLREDGTVGCPESMPADDQRLIHELEDARYATASYMEALVCMLGQLDGEEARYAHELRSVMEQFLQVSEEAVRTVEANRIRC